MRESLSWFYLQVDVCLDSAANYLAEKLRVSIDHSSKSFCCTLKLQAIEAIDYIKEVLQVFWKDVYN